MVHKCLAFLLPSWLPDILVCKNKLERQEEETQPRQESEKRNPNLMEGWGGENVTELTLPSSLESKGWETFSDLQDSVIVTV